MTNSPIFVLAMTLFVVAIRAKLVSASQTDILQTLRMTTSYPQVSTTQTTTTTSPHSLSQAEIVANRLLEIIHDEAVFDSSSLYPRIESRMQPSLDETSPVIVNNKLYSSNKSIKTINPIGNRDEKKLRIRNKRSNFSVRKQSSDISSSVANTNNDASVKGSSSSSTSTSTSTSTSAADVCDSKMQVITPYFAKNSKGKLRVVVNSELMQQAIQIETCRQQSTSRCQGDCGCEQKFKWYRLLVRDIADKSRGLFTDWFLFPSNCVCRCATNNNQKQFLKMIHANHH